MMRGFHIDNEYAFDINIISNGHIDIRDVLYEYDDLCTFTFVSNKMGLMFAHLYQSFFEEVGYVVRYIATTTSTNIMDKLVEGLIGIREVFCLDCVWILDMIDGDFMDAYCIPQTMLPENALPKEGVMIWPDMPRSYEFDLGNEFISGMMRISCQFDAAIAESIVDYITRHIEKMPIHIRRKFFEKTNRAYNVITFNGDGVYNRMGIDPGLAAEINKLVPLLVEETRKSRARKKRIEREPRLAMAGRRPTIRAAKSRYWLTDVAAGSFGLVFEEIAPEDEIGRLTEESSEIKMAADEAQAILKRVIDAEYPDEALASESAEIVSAVKSILSVCKDYNVSMNIWQYGETGHSFTAENLRQAAAALDEVIVRTREDIFEGQLLGLLPESTRFEFKQSGQEEITSGLSDFNFEVASEVNVRFSKKKCYVRLEEKATIKGNKTIISYTLIGIAETRKELEYDDGK